MHKVEKIETKSSLNISQISPVQDNEDEDVDKVLRIEDLVDLNVSQLIDSFQAMRFQRQRLEEMKKSEVTSSSTNLRSSSYVAPQNNPAEIINNNVTGPADPPKPNPRAPEWSDPLARQLQSLLIYKLHTIFNAAIQRLVDCGYEESAAKRAVSGAGLFRGGNNIVENIVNEALNVLKNGENGGCTDGNQFGSLGEMIEFTMMEMVLVLVEMKPSLTVGEAMWWFFVFDMDIAQACGDQGDLLAELRGRGATVAGDSPSSTAAPRRIVDKANQLRSLAARGKENSSEKLKNRKELDLLRRVFSEIAMKSPAQSQKKESKSTAPTSSSNAESIPNRADYCDEIPFDESAGIYVPRDSKEEKILNLVEWVEKLEKEVQSWNDWANQKVMEAATKLKKDQAELAFLREEKELFEKYKKEKKRIDENMEKSMLELQCSLDELRGEFEQANGTIAKLKEEQSELRKEMEAAKMEAAKTSAKCKEALEKERKALKEVESWKGKVSSLQEVIKAHKQNIDELQLELSIEEKVRTRLQETLKEEKTQKEQLLKQVASLKRFEAALIEEEEAAKEKAKMDMHKYEELIKVLNEEVSQLKSKAESSRIADLRRDIYGVKGEGSRPENGQKRDRECVLCLSEEPSVVFVPCGHEVLCGGCNEVHEKQGMKECPSCRTPIGKRIAFRFSHI